MKKVVSRKIVSLIFLILLTLVSCYYLYSAMQWGPWAFSDSSAYLSAARNFASGYGFVVFQSTGEIKAVTEFPPFYPMLLSVFGGKDGDYIRTIQWFNTIVFGFSILLFSIIFYIATNNLLLSILSTAFFISFPKIVSTFSSAMSEPLFLFLILLSLFFFLLYLKKRNPFLLICTIFVSALLPVTRYAGFLFVGIYALGLFFLLKNASIIQKLKTVFTYLILSLIPIGIWGMSLIRNFNKFGGKRYSLDLEIIKKIFRSFVEEFEIIKHWIPYVDYFQNQKFVNAAIIFSILISITLLWFAIRKKNPSESNQIHTRKSLLVISSLAVFGYFVFIGFTHSITIPQIDIIDRMMIPIYPFMVFSIFLIFDILFSRKESIILNIILISISFLFLRFNTLKSIVFINDLKTDGYGFTARNYQQSGIIDAIKMLPKDQIMVSNSAGFVLFYANIYPIENENFPNHIFGTGGSYGEKLFRANDAALILFFSDFSNHYNDPSGNFLNRLTDTLKVEYMDDVGGIFFYPGTSPSTQQ